MISSSRVSQSEKNRPRFIKGLPFFLAGLFVFLVWFFYVPSNPPVVFPITSESVATNYVQEFSRPFKLEEKGQSPDKRWKLFIKEENTRDILPGDFYSVRMKDEQLGIIRLLFTLWDADTGSGLRMTTRWSEDGKALQLKGDTRGFSYFSAHAAPKYDSFNFVYLIEEDKLYALPTVPIMN